MELTSADRRLLESASDCMLRPLEHASPLKYLIAVSEQLRPLIGAFAAICGTRDPEGVIGLDSAQWSRGDRELFARWKLRDAGTERALEHNSDVVTMRKAVGDDWQAFDRDPMMNEWYRPRGISDVAAYLLYWIEDDALATIELHHKEFGTPRFGEDGEFLLSLLQPSFRAGMRLFYTVGRLRESLARDMDALDVPLVVCSREGRIHHLSTPVRVMLAGDPEGAVVIDGIPDVAAQVVACGGSRQRGRSASARAVHQVITTKMRRYRLSAALATHAMHFGRTDVLVTVHELRRDRPAGDLGSHYRLSARERQVALLIARGLSNEAIARNLGVSVHTAKRHIEHVFTKLGVHSRSAVAALVGAAGL